MKAETVKLQVKTVKRLAILIAVFGLVGGTSVFTQQFQLKRLGQKELAKAELAFKKRDFVEAERLFQEHLEVFPDDVEVQIKFADALLKVDSKSQARQSNALQLYDGILTRDPSNKDVVRLRMNLKVEMGQFVSVPRRANGADVDVEQLLKSSPDDGELLYLRGRCYEAEGDDTDASKKAVLMYRTAIDHNAPQKIDASEHLATLLRDRLGQPKEADKVIEKLVTDDSENYRVYLARGNYRLALAARDQSQKSLRSDANKDFQTARQRAPKEPEIYLCLAKSVSDPSQPKDNQDEVKRILEDGKKNVRWLTSNCAPAGLTRQSKF
jgi:tetratricopeptide (TPR) repeat protein